VTGPGGSGKTRLAIEACSRSRKSGIAAAFAAKLDAVVVERTFAR
jgi:RecA/RadA recombinase